MLTAEDRRRLEEELRDWAQQVRIDASGEAGRMSSSSMYTLAAKLREAADALAAAVALPDAPARFAWLLERRLVSDERALRGTSAGTLVYWDGGHAQSFTNDPWKAVQWPTKEAAMQTCPPEHYRQWGWDYVEHGFAAAPPSLPGGPQETP